MKDSTIQGIVDGVQEYVDEINESIKLLHNKDVEIKLAFNDAKNGNPPNIYIWKAIEHVDYIKAPK